MIRRPDPDLVRKGELLAIPAHQRSFKQNMEWIELEHRLAEKLDRKIEAERKANELAEAMSEGRIYPQNQSTHDD